MSCSFTGIVVYKSRVPHLCSCFYPVVGVTIFPFIFLAQEEEKGKGITSPSQEEIVRHERIHIAQTAELCCVCFYLVWVFDFFSGLCCLQEGKRKFCGCGCDAGTSYTWNRLEQEAFENQGDPDYLKTRECCAWRNYPTEKTQKMIVGLIDIGISFPEDDI
mmetsp:Transcript_16101/g.18232  ORF Transcript_16101/g.18232 Transcript_16101/m.18232 type:complete len:161 (+) Transcript_16101:146-628(+)